MKGISVRELGKYVGHCPKCRIAIGEKEVSSACSRCGTLLHLDEVVSTHAVKPEKQNKKESKNAEFTTSVLSVNRRC